MHVTVEAGHEGLPSLCDPLDLMDSAIREQAGQITRLFRLHIAVP